MASYDPGNSRQIIAALVGDSARNSKNNRCPKCDRFGIVSGTHDYYGIIYRCSCLPVLWVISPETGEKVEGG
jgi:hypothetical protein